MQTQSTDHYFLGIADWERTGFWTIRLRLTAAAAAVYDAEAATAERVGKVEPHCGSAR